MACNGNCNQGRKCDCVPDVEIDFDEDFGLVRGLISVTVITVIVSLVSLVLFVVSAAP